MQSPSIFLLVSQLSFGGIWFVFHFFSTLLPCFTFSQEAKFPLSIGNWQAIASNLRSVVVYIYLNQVKVSCTRIDQTQPKCSKIIMTRIELRKTVNFNKNICKKNNHVFRFVKKIFKKNIENGKPSVQ